jgi:predicted nucleotidyltransferase/HEPN domain-containing protein
MGTSVIAGDEILEQIVREIVSQIQPRRIVLFGSRARGNARFNSDYDLMVELEFDDYFARRREVESAAQVPDVDVDIHLRKPGELEARRDDAGRMDWDIWREGVVLYPPGAALPRAEPARDDRPTTAAVRSTPHEHGQPPDSVRHWLDWADQDLLVIERCLAAEPVPWGGASFHAQQAADKYLTALLLVKQRVLPPRPHELASLIDAVRSAGYDMPDFAAECEALKPYAIDVRYPENTPIPGNITGLAALAAARRIIDATRRFL